MFGAYPYGAPYFGQGPALETNVVVSDVGDLCGLFARPMNHERDARRLNTPRMATPLNPQRDAKEIC